MQQQLGLIGHGERLRSRDAPLVGAGHLERLTRALEHAPVGALGHVDLRLEAVDQREQVGEHAALDPVVRLEDGEPIARGLVDAAVDGRAVAAVGLVDDADARVVRRVRPHDGGRPVRRPVVHADDLEEGEALLLERGERLVEVLLHVVDGDDHRDKMVLLRHVPSSASRGSKTCNLYTS